MFNSIKNMFGDAVFACTDFASAHGPFANISGVKTFGHVGPIKFEKGILPAKAESVSPADTPVFTGERKGLLEILMECVQEREMKKSQAVKTKDGVLKDNIPENIKFDLSGILERLSDKDFYDVIMSATAARRTMQEEAPQSADQQGPITGEEIHPFGKPSAVTHHDHTSAAPQEIQTGFREQSEEELQNDLVQKAINAFCDSPSGSVLTVNGVPVSSIEETEGSKEQTGEEIFLTRTLSPEKASELEEKFKRVRSRKQK